MAKVDFQVRNYHGRNTFNFILKQVKDCIDDIRFFFKDVNAEEIYTEDFLKKAYDYVEERHEIDLTEMALYDIAYLIVYYGVSYLDVNSLLRLLGNYYKSHFLQHIAIYIHLKPHRDSDLFIIWNAIEGYHEAIIDAVLNLKQNNKNTLVQENVRLLLREKYFKYYGGHQTKLGHYYRHIFQSVKYIDEQDVLTYKEKYSFIKNFRAQISSPEQYLLFFNSISCLGRAWEFQKINDKCYSKYYITKYNLIKNIPDVYLFNMIDIKAFYPLVEFELSKEPDGRSDFLKLVSA